VTAHDLRLSRRTVLGTGLLIGLSVGTGGKLLAQPPGGPPKGPPPVDPNAFVHIAADDTVTVLSKHLEMGQGPMTGMATIVCEELDADWSQMRGGLAPANDKLYANLLMGMQGTGGSTAMAAGYEQMRRAGAMARAMLVRAAATEWKVPAEQVTVDKGRIRHAASKRESGFGAFAEAAAKLPVPQDVKLKDPASFRYIGHDRRVGRTDSLAKTNGTAKFSIDQTAPGMLTCVVARSPRFGGKVKSFDAAKALAVRGVVAVKEIPSGVAVFAKSTWPAIKGRNALHVEWDDAKAETRGSDDMAMQYLARARQPGVKVKGEGDVAAAMATPGATLVEADYVFPYLAHAPMEPLGGFALWDGRQCVAKFGCQFPGLDRPAMARVFGVNPEQVNIDVVLAGGSFGRRAQGSSHLAVELAEVAKAMPNTPVRLTWTREDDLTGGYYRPFMVHHLRGAVKDGQVLAWADTIVGQSFAVGGPMEKMMIRDDIDSTMTEGADKPAYKLAAYKCEAVIDKTTPVTSLWWRSVGHTHTSYAVETFIDHLLEKAGKDPVAGRLELMQEEQRGARVLEAVAKLANWGGPVPAGRARGVAVHESFGTMVAEIAEVSISDNGEPRVHKMWAAVDCGTAINPDVVRAQIEGGIGYAVGHILYAEVPLDKGRPTVTNFTDYRSLRINEMPEIEVMILRSMGKPSGIGEPGVPPAGPAIANALAKLGRDRPLRLPMVRA